MKNIKTIFTSIALIAFIGVNAQHNKSTQIKKETTIKHYDVIDGDNQIDYTLKIDNKEMNKVTLEATDRNMKEQDRVLPPMKVTKTISIKSENNPIYNNILQITYKTKGDDKFDITPTNNGFVFSVVGKDLNYNLLQKKYVINDEYKDFFKVVGKDQESKK